MKKFLFSVLAMIILVSLLLSCNTLSHGTGPQTTEKREIIIRDVDFPQYLDEISFVNGLSQASLLDLLATYEYNGKKLSSILPRCHYDTAYGGGCYGSNDLFGYYNDYTVTNDLVYWVYTNRFFTKVQIDGFVLPNEINFDYTLSDVLLSLNIDIDPAEAFADAQDATVTIRSDGNSSLKLTNCLLLEESSKKSEYHYQLVYEESYSVEYKNGSDGTVTRYVEMSFTKDDCKLGSFEVSVSEKGLRT